MKLTNEKLIQIIKEELESVIDEKKRLQKFLTLSTTQKRERRK